jgi:DNA-directed RNA polymerase specialized sigma24 family protein
MSSSADRRFPVHRLPGDAAIAHARSRLARRYRIPEGEIDDLIAEAMLAVLAYPQDRMSNPDGLLLRIVDRRAQDFIERSRLSRSRLGLLAAAPASSEHPGERAADLYLRARAIPRIRIRGVSPARLLRLLPAIAAGATSGEAFRAERIPRGSWSRYRAALRLLPQLLDRLTKKSRSFSPPSNDS